MTAALSSDQVTFWWITLGLGLVVNVVVAVLLMLLTSLVRDVDRAVAEVWDEAAGVATQTATTWMLATTASLATDLRDETRKHAELLAGAGQPAAMGRTT
ncbi:MAG: hypothetical protein ACRD0N_14735 [Acidimicrobiales bacterium]